MAAPSALPNCENCAEEIPYAAKNCVLCGEDVGYPNVRAAESADEVSALRERLRAALISTEARGCRAELEQFGTAASGSAVVVSRNLAVLAALVESSNTLISTYHKLVGAEARLPEQNEFDPYRAIVEGMVHPHGVHENITFGAITLDGRGVVKYGAFSINLKQDMISNRTTVFEENPFSFCDRHACRPNKPFPPGYRASWQRRAELAMAKLHPKIQPGISPAEFPSILLEVDPDKIETDFIEAHVYGPVHPKAIARVVLAAQPKATADRLIWKRVRQKLVDMGVEIEEP